MQRASEVESIDRAVKNSSSELSQGGGWRREQFHRGSSVECGTARFGSLGRDDGIGHRSSKRACILPQRCDGSWQAGVDNVDRNRASDARCRVLVPKVKFSNSPRYQSDTNAQASLSPMFGGAASPASVMASLALSGWSCIRSLESSLKVAETPGPIDVAQPRSRSLFLKAFQPNPRPSLTSCLSSDFPDYSPHSPQCAVNCSICSFLLSSSLHKCCTSSLESPTATKATPKQWLTQASSPPI
jgi:hypothetical protein